MSKNKKMGILDDQLIHSCDICELPCTLQLKVYLSFLSPKEPSNPAKEHVTKVTKKMANGVRKMWLSCVLLAIMKILQRDKLDVGGKKIKPLTRNITSKRGKSP